MSALGVHHERFARERKNLNKKSSENDDKTKLHLMREKYCLLFPIINLEHRLHFTHFYVLLSPCQCARTFEFTLTKFPSAFVNAASIKAFALEIKRRLNRREFLREVRSRMKEFLKEFSEIKNVF